MKRKKKIKYAKISTLPRKISPKEEMVMISARIDGDLLDELKAAAKIAKMPYQSLLKELCRAKLGLEPRRHLSHEGLEKIKDRKGPTIWWAGKHSIDRWRLFQNSSYGNEVDDGSGAKIGIDCDQWKWMRVKEI